MQTKDEAGFTLIEIIIALTVLAISLGSTYALFNNSVKNNYKLNQRMFAEWTAHNYALTQQTADDSKLDQAAIRLKNGPYTFEIKTAILSTPSPDFKKLKITVYDSVAQEELTSLIAYVAKEAGL